MVRDPEELIRTFWGRVWLRGELELIDELFAEPFVRHWAEGTQVLTRDEYRNRIADALDRSSPVSAHIDALDVVEDRVWARISSTRVAVATHQTMAVTWMQQHRIVDGRIAETWTLYETGLQWPSMEWERR